MRLRNTYIWLTAACLLAQLSLSEDASALAPKAGKKTSASAKSSKKGAATQKTKPAINSPYRSWLPSGRRSRAVLLCVHGLGFSSASFEDFGKSLSSLGYATYAVDVRGFGSWIKKEGKETVDFESCLFDVEQALKSLHQSYPGEPVFVVGESMGGAIALRAAARFPSLVQGLISAVPSRDRFHKTKEQLKVGFHLLGDGDKPIDVGSIVLKGATDDPELRKKWQENPLNRMKLSAKELKQFDDFMKENHDSAALIEHLPVLFLAGFKDKLVKPEGTIEIFNEVTSPDKIMIVVGDGEHLLFEENQLSDEVTWILTGWINSRMGVKEK